MRIVSHLFKRAFEVNATSNPKAFGQALTVIPNAEKTSAPYPPATRTRALRTASASSRVGQSLAPAWHPPGLPSRNPSPSPAVSVNRSTAYQAKVCAPYHICFLYVAALEWPDEDHPTSAPRTRFGAGACRGTHAALLSSGPYQLYCRIVRTDAGTESQAERLGVFGPTRRCTRR